MSTLIQCAFVGIGITFIACGPLAQPLSTTKIPFDIEQQPLPDAVNVWAEQARLQVVWPEPAKAAHQIVRPLIRKLSPEAALQILLQGSGFNYFVTDPTTVTIEPEVSVTRTELTHKNGQREPVTKKPAGTIGSRAGSVDSSNDELPTEVLVTGSHIRGVGNSAAPTHVFEFDDIELTGAGTVQDFLEMLPQYLGTASEATAGGTGGAASLNAVGASGIDLRGLGVSSTLVLVNGRRVAPGNMVGNFVDVLLIPLSAVERIEMVTDGASSIYGADAVAGVVNFILRKDFEGAETRVRYGAVDPGRRYEVTASQTLGGQWGLGHGLVTYEYLKSTPLSADERPYSRSAARPLTLLPEQTRHGVFATVEQRISSTTSLSLDGTYSQRSSQSANSVAGLELSFLSSAEVKERGGTLGVRRSLSIDSQLAVTARYSQNDGRLSQYKSASKAFLFSDVEAQTRIKTIDANVDGKLWESNAGSAKYAIGAQYRNERFESHNLLTNSGFRPSRDLFAGYGELQIPLIGSKNAQPWADKLEINLADRYEDSDDFGSSNNPQIGILWAPIRWVNLRGTYGTSFKAPLLVDINPVPAQVVALPMFDPVSGASTNTLILFGGNPDLGPEKATTWTLGADLTFDSIPKLKASATYFNIHLSDRILAPQTKVDIFDALRIESLLGPAIVQRNPPQSVVQQLASAGGFFATNVDLSTVRAIIDNRSQNLARIHTSGIDLNISYELESSVGRSTLGLDVTRVLNFESRFNARSKTQEMLDTPYNPVTLRARGYALFGRGSTTLGIFVKHADDYRDNRNGGTRRIASWTTADVTASYRPDSATGILEHASIVFAVANILGAAPPYVRNQTYAVNYDATNASGKGRLYSLQLSKGFQ